MVAESTNKPLKKKLAVIDLETDPFKWGRIPRPFAAAFYDGEQYIEFWGVDCVYLLVGYILSLECDYYIYAHNGGKFDFFYLMEEGVLDNPVKIINGRIVTAMIGPHELRDSYAILPVPLKAYEKDEIDYAKFESEVRNYHKSEILKYLKHDCEYLFDLVKKFLTRFGLNLTIGSTALKKLSELHPFKKTQNYHDVLLRPYYFGGRVQCFEHGILEGDFKIYDVNSMYPYVMKYYKHPVGTDYLTAKGGVESDGNLELYGDQPYFINFIGENRGAIPIRTKKGLDFTCREGEFFTTSHELKIGLKYGLIKIKKIIKIKIPVKTICFDKYVDTYMEDKIDAKNKGDRASELFAKLLLNSAYGKFGQNPENYHDYFLRYVGEEPPIGCDLYLDYGGVEIWRKPITQHIYNDVAVAASVTGASRAVLLDALHSARRVVYCDTDSIICESLDNVKMHDSDLGAWKLEGVGNRLAIAGKKLYALRDGDVDIKKASKGVTMNSDDIFDVAQGGEYHHRHDAPNFKLSGRVVFTDRRVRSTK